MRPGDKLVVDVSAQAADVDFGNFGEQGIEVIEVTDEGKDARRLIVRGYYDDVAKWDAAVDLTDEQRVAIGRALLAGGE